LRIEDGVIKLQNNLIKQEKKMTEPTSPNIAASLFVTHKVITRSLAVVGQNGEIFARQGYPEPVYQEGFSNYCRAFVSVLDAHHQIEDLIIFPYFTDRLPGAPFKALTRQHQVIIPHLERIQEILDQAKPDDQDKTGLFTILRSVEYINKIWHPHIRLEEQHLEIQKIADMLPFEEQLRLLKEAGEFSQAHSGPPFLTIPFVLFNLEKDARTVMAQSMPSEVVEHLLPVVWKEQWQSMRPFLLD
jgi:hemerythrin-like domain-containing protein